MRTASLPLGRRPYPRRRPHPRRRHGGQAIVEHLLLTACVAIVLLLPFADAEAPGALMARAIARFARAFVALMSWS